MNNFIAVDSAISCCFYKESIEAVSNLWCRNGCIWPIIDWARAAGSWWVVVRRRSGVVWAWTVTRRGRMMRGTTWTGIRRMVWATGSRGTGICWCTWDRCRVCRKCWAGRRS